MKRAVFEKNTVMSLEGSFSTKPWYLIKTLLIEILPLSFAPFKAKMQGLPTVKRGVLQIHDILGWIRIRIPGSKPLTNGSGSGIRILLFSSLTFKMQEKTNF
jgi:hypothetical protein